MKKRKLICGVMLGMTLALGSVSMGYMGSDTVIVQAEDNLEDDLSQEKNSVKDDTGVIEFFQNHNSMTQEQLNTASATMTPITNIIGYVMGGVIALTSSAIFLITALDLLYISVPFSRGLLYKSSGGGQGMQGGFGASQGGGGKSTQWVSDEAVQSLQGVGGSGQSQGGFGMQQQQQSGGTKSTILTYFKKRLFFVVLFAICTVILTSSILLGTGVNLAQWGMRLIEIFNDLIPSL